MALLEGADVGVLFQNQESLRKNEGLISIDHECNTKSCYVELHRNDELNSVKYFSRI